MNLIKTLFITDLAILAWLCTYAAASFFLHTIQGFMAGVGL